MTAPKPKRITVGAARIPADPPDGADEAGYRLGVALGLNPFEVATDSVNITPRGDHMIVSWQGVKAFTRDEFTAALERAKAPNHTDGGRS